MRADLWSQLRGAGERTFEFETLPVGECESFMRNNEGRKQTAMLAGVIYNANNNQALN